MFGGSFSSFRKRIQSMVYISLFYNVSLTLTPFFCCEFPPKMYSSHAELIIQNDVEIDEVNWNHLMSIRGIFVNFMHILIK